MALPPKQYLIHKETRDLQSYNFMKFMHHVVNTDQKSR